MDDRTRAMLEAPAAPLLARMAAPNAIAFLVQASVSMVEVWFIGRLGTASLAAIALAFPLLMLTQTMSGGATGGAVSSAVARALGAGDLNKAEQLIWHALVIAGVAALGFLALFLGIGARFLTFLGGRGEVLSQSIQYCTVLFSGGIFIWLMGVLSAVFRGTGDMKFPALLMVVSAVIQIPLSGCLILGKFGFPQLGLVGAAYSAVVSALLISILLLIRLAFGNQQLKLHARFHLQRPLFRDILKVALPASLSPLLTVTNILMLTAIVGRFGESALAGYGIGSRVEFLLIPLVFGLGAAMTSLVGINIGAGNVARAERIGWIGGSAAALMTGATGALLALFPHLWIPAFTSDPATYEAARGFILILGPCFAFQGLGLSLYFASQGAGRVAWPVIATVLRVVLAVGGAMVAVTFFQGGLQSVYLAAAAGMVLYGIMIGSSLKLGAWRP